MRIALIVLALAVLALPGCRKPASSGKQFGTKDNPIVMAFVPSIEAEKVFSSGGQLCALLAERTGLQFKPLAATSYVGVVEAMAVDKVQVAWLPPMAYVFAHQRNGDKVILKVVRHGKPTYRGQVLVAQDSPVKTLADLKGKRIAFPDPTSASGHLYPKALLLAAGVDIERDAEAIFSGGHDAAITALLKGSADAACTYEDARNNLKETFPDIMETTRVVEFTDPIPADCVAVTDALPPAMVEQITATLVELAKEPLGRQVLDDLYEVEGLVPAEDGDYEPVRRMAQQLGLDVEEQVKSGG
jgi:phosphonate transport system substrate-binding protein